MFGFYPFFLFAVYGCESRFSPPGIIDDVEAEVVLNDAGYSVRRSYSDVLFETNEGQVWHVSIFLFIQPVGD
jgi:hypothetical protein